MTEPIFDHDRLDVYRLAVQYPAEAFRVAKGLSETPADRLDADSDGDEGRRRGRIASRVP